MKILSRAFAGLAMLCAVLVAGVMTAPMPLLAQSVGFFQQIGIGAVVRTVISKLREARFSVADFGTPQQALDAAVLLSGGVVWFPCGTYSIGTGGSSAPGLTFDNAFFPITLTGPSNGWAASPGTCLTINYAGTGTIISARNTRAPQIDHLFLYGPSATKGIDLSGSVSSPTVGSIFPIVSDNAIEALGGASAIGIDIDDTQGARIKHNFLGINGGIGISGVRSAGHFAVSATIADNTFGSAGAGNRIAISGPGETWSVTGNIVEGPTAAFIGAGPTGTCKALYLAGNWIGDYSPGVGATDAIVHSNCNTLTSFANRYANATGSTAIIQDVSTGSVISSGDVLEGTNGININTGNQIDVRLPNTSSLVGTVVVGTPFQAQSVFGVLYSQGYGPPASSTAALTDGQLIVGQTGAAPLPKTVTGDLGVSAGGAFTLNTVNAGVGTFGSATSCVTVTNNAKGLTTAISAATCTPAVGSITGFGAGVAAALAIIPNAAGGFLAPSQPMYSPTAPVATTFCTSPSIPNSNGTGAFTVNVGTACATSTGTITMPAATTGWVCDFHNITNFAANKPDQSGGTTTTVTLTNFSRTTGAATNWTSSDVIRAQCAAY